jgi:sugar/nucleoside kinase (ribokinase family)
MDLRFGGALNTASVTQALGWPTLLAFPSSGSPFDRLAEDAVRSLGITVLGWKVATGPPISIVFTHGSDRSFLSSASFEAMDRCPQLPVRGWIHVAGLREAHRIGPRLAEARARGAKISIATAWTPDELRQLRRSPGRLWDLLVLNEAEASLIAPEPNEAIEHLTGVAEEIVVTSAHKSRAYLDGGLLSVDHEPVERVVDATGAGDAFCAGLLLARERGSDGAAALEYAGRVASRVLRISGGTVSNPALFSGLEVPC